MGHRPPLRAENPGHSNKAAARLNAHTTTAMVDRVYDVDRATRQHNELKGLDNAFA